MGKILYLDCGMGAAGDMLAAALYDLLDEKEQQAFLSEMAEAGIPHTEITAERVVKSGITGTHMHVKIAGEEEHTEDVHAHGHEHEHPHDHEHHHDHEHPHDHEHHHGHHHEHHSMAEIRAVIGALKLPEEVKADAAAIYDEIAAAESRVHGTPVGEIHLHEVGMLDAIADVASVASLIHRLQPSRVVVSPVTTGYGSVRCAHGILPVPAPATALILEGVPSRAGDIEGELLTPTGAALIKHFADAYGEAPVMTPVATGYGMGTKEFPRLNCVRAILGDEVLENGGGTDRITELACNLDDMTGEEIGFAVEELLKGGAVDVWTSAIQMKKNRPGTLLTVLCKEEAKEDVIRQIFRLTTTIGIRETLHRRYVLDREIASAECAHGTVRKKVVSGYGVSREKPEYEDVAAIAREKGLSLKEAVKDMLG